MSQTHTIRSWISRTAAATALVLLAGPAFAQDGAGPPSPEEMKEKVKEIERLMKQAEKALARSVDSRKTSEETAAKIEKLLDEKARESTGKSADELRKMAEEGSESASQALKRLMEQAKSESSSASEGVRKLLEETRQSGQGARQGIQWILDNATSQGQGGGGGQSNKPQQGSGKPKDQQGKKEPKDGKENDQKPDPQADRPESDTEPPRSPDMERWLAELPPQVRRAYETQDWDSIPPKWRDILRAWTKKMADRLEKERR